jgi:PTS system fructose-specific IIC component
MNFDDPLLNLAAILIAGIVGGEIISHLRLPKVTGWIGAGIALRALALPGLDSASLDDFTPFVDFVLGFIAFTVGAKLRFQRLRNAEKRLALLLFGEALITPTVVLLVLVSLGGLRVDVAMLLAAIAIAGSPGSTLVVIRESRAKGLLSKTLSAASGLIDMVAIGTFTFCAAWLSRQEAGGGHALAAVGFEFGLALVIGLGCSLVIVALTWRLVSPAFVGPATVALILAAWGFAEVFEVSSILACTFAGMALANLQQGTARTAEAYLRPFGGVLFAGFYTLVGMHLDFALVVPMLGLVFVYFAARAVGKSLSAFVSMHLAEVPHRVRNNLGLALLPQGGVAVGLILELHTDPQLAGIADTVAALGLAALAINELLGPAATRFSLARAGESGQNRPRLLGFLEEHRIVHEISGDKREVIEALADRLYATTPMPIPKAKFVAKVLEREQEASTCLGRGLAIPHAVICEGEQICGVLGISTKGLDFDAYDGYRIHAVLLLATPESERQRHLEILASLARALAKNKNLREQLYYARSAGHAYEILHVDETGDLNYFLDAEPC